MFQHLQMKKNGETMDYIVSGAAVFPNDIPFHKLILPKHSLKYFWGKWKGLGGFAYFNASSRNVTVQFISGINQTLYQTIMFPRK